MLFHSADILELYLSSHTSYTGTQYKTQYILVLMLCNIELIEKVYSFHLV